MSCRYEFGNPRRSNEADLLSRSAKIAGPPRATPGVSPGADPPARHFKRPESVLVVIYTAAGEVLMLRRSTPRHFWQSVTGSLLWGESPALAASRELAEETGLRNAGRIVDWRRGESFPIVAPWREKYSPSDRVNREHWFRLRLSGRRIVCLSPGEHIQARWLHWSRAAQLASSRTNRRAILRLVGEGLVPWYAI